ncbi:hypothetical protein CHU98_g9372 [Xylaria longipes]|nr:hypothetical protein CHU98_g9372 [Xylaria longipes]
MAAFRHDDKTRRGEDEQDSTADAGYLCFSTSPLTSPRGALASALRHTPVVHGLPFNWCVDGQLGPYLRSDAALPLSYLPSGFGDSQSTSCLTPTRTRRRPRVFGHQTSIPVSSTGVGA